MTFLSIRMTLLAGLGAVAMTTPAAASLAVSGKTDVRPAQAAPIQYAQDFNRGMSVNNVWKSKKHKSAKKTTTTGNASTKTDTNK